MQIGFENCHEQWLTHHLAAAQNITYITCGMPDRDRGPVSTAVALSSMGLALLLVAVRIVAIAPNFSTLWGWDDLFVAIASVSSEIWTTLH